jgi:hypothetical protein
MPATAPSTSIANVLFAAFDRISAKWRANATRSDGSGAEAVVDAVEQAIRERLSASGTPSPG